MIDQIIFINYAGLSIYTWSPLSETKDSTLISGFLSALNMFATGERGEQIHKINLSPTTFLFDRAADIIFVMLTKDPDIEPILLLILKALKERFLALHEPSLKEFDGDIQKYMTFDTELEAILNIYGYFDYQRLTTEFSKSTVESVLYIEKNSGDILYSKAKGYLDKKTLSFQSLILVKTAERILKSFNEVLLSIILVSELPRCLIFNATEKILLFHELKTLSKDSLNLNDISEKKLNNMIKKPGKLVFEILDPFFVMNQQGNITITNDKQDRLRKHEINADCVTLTNNARNLASQMYKEKVYSVIIIGKCISLVAFPLENYIVFLQIDVNQCTDTNAQPGTLEYCETLSKLEQDKMKEIFAHIRKFREKFD